MRYAYGMPLQIAPMVSGQGQSHFASAQSGVTMVLGAVLYPSTTSRGRQELSVHMASGNPAVGGAEGHTEQEHDCVRVAHPPAVHAAMNIRVEYSACRTEWRTSLTANREVVDIDTKVVKPTGQSLTVVWW
jgi:hypothetical protein